MIAAAGSGKTRAVTDRIAHLAQASDAVHMLPRLVVVTFANRAADEMQQRAREQILLAKPKPEILAAFNRAWFGTIHAFCLKLLNDYGHYLGLPAPLELITDDDDLWNEFVQQQTRVVVRSAESATRTRSRPCGTHGTGEGRSSLLPPGQMFLSRIIWMKFTARASAKRRHIGTRSRSQAWERAIVRGVFLRCLSVALKRRARSSGAGLFLWELVESAAICVAAEAREYAISPERSRTTARSALPVTLQHPASARAVALDRSYPHEARYRSRSVSVFAMRGRRRLRALARKR